MNLSQPFEHLAAHVGGEKGTKRWSVFTDVSCTTEEGILLAPRDNPQVLKCEQGLVVFLNWSNCRYN